MWLAREECHSVVRQPHLIDGKLTNKTLQYQEDAENEDGRIQKYQVY